MLSYLQIHILNKSLMDRISWKEIRKDELSNKIKILHVNFENVTKLMKTYSGNPPTVNRHLGLLPTMSLNLVPTPAAKITAWNSIILIILKTSLNLQLFIAKNCFKGLNFEFLKTVGKCYKICAIKIQPRVDYDKILQNLNEKHEA